MLKKLEEKLHNEIPMTKYMQLTLEELNDNNLITKAPLEPNINDKGTGFAGSLNTIATISAWCVCYLEASKLDLENSMIAIIKSDISYRAPITKDFECKTYLPSKEQIKLFEKKMKEKSSSSLKIKGEIIEDGKLCLDFEGVYVIKKR